MVLQCMTLLILKQLHSVLYSVLDMGQGSLYSSCFFVFDVCIVFVKVAYKGFLVGGSYVY